MGCGALSVGGQGRSPLRIDWMPVRRSVVREDHAVGEGPGGGDDQIALAEDPRICGALGGADQAEAVAPVHQVYGLAAYIGAQAAEKLQRALLVMRRAAEGTRRPLYSRRRISPC